MNHAEIIEAWRVIEPHRIRRADGQRLTDWNDDMKDVWLRHTLSSALPTILALLERFSEVA